MFNSLTLIENHSWSQECVDVARHDILVTKAIRAIEIPIYCKVADLSILLATIHHRG